VSGDCACLHISKASQEESPSHSPPTPSSLSPKNFLVFFAPSLGEFTVHWQTEGDSINGHVKISLPAGSHSLRRGVYLDMTIALP
jgi:hypothetical protein